MIVLAYTRPIWPGYSWSTGFSTGHILKLEDSSIALRSNSQKSRTIELWKVHGSIDSFYDGVRRVTSFPPSLNHDCNFEPTIVAPGRTKYENVYDEPFRSIVTGADRALVPARAFFCVGFGFNDKHIQPKLVDGITKMGKPIVVLAKKLSPQARTLLLTGNCKNFLASKHPAKSFGTVLSEPRELGDRIPAS